TDYRELLSEAYRDQARLQRDAGQATAAVATLLELRELWPGHARRLYQVARELALCLPQLGQDKIEGNAAAQALETLRQAITAGYRDTPSLQNERALDPLRGRADFQALVAQLTISSKFTAPTGEVSRFTGHTHPWVEGVAFLPDGRHALSAGFDKL